MYRYIIIESSVVDPDPNPIGINFKFFSFKIDYMTLDPDPIWAKIQDPDQNSMYLNPQHLQEGEENY